MRKLAEVKQKHFTMCMTEKSEALGRTCWVFLHHKCGVTGWASLSQIFVLCQAQHEELRKLQWRQAVCPKLESEPARGQTGSCPVLPPVPVPLLGCAVGHRVCASPIVWGFCCCHCSFFANGFRFPLALTFTEFSQDIVSLLDIAVSCQTAHLDHYVMSTLALQNSEES